MSRKEELKQEAAAWRECAEWVAENSVKARAGLCVLLARHVRDEPVALLPRKWPHNPMYDRVKRHAQGNVTGCYLDEIDGDDDEGYSTAVPDARVIFCLLMALECEAEAKEVTRRKH